MKKFILLSVAAAVLLTGCSAGGGSSSGSSSSPGSAVSSSESGFKTVTPAQAKARIDAKEDLVILDVRTKEEYDEGHIADSVLLPYDAITAESAAAKLPDKSKPVFVYCRTGRRSAIAAQTLADLGYTAVFDLGGIQSWPYGTVS